VAGIRFEWDAAKSRANQRKHGVSFEEAQSVFFDERALFMADPEHSDDEDRFLLLGLSVALRVILVCHCLRDDDHTIRIIHARRATKAEQEQYWSRVQ
jgi:uncharacterized DUF497 family protein